MSKISEFIIKAGENPKYYITNCSIVTHSSGALVQLMTQSVGSELKLQQHFVVLTKAVLLHVHSFPEKPVWRTK